MQQYLSIFHPIPDGLATKYTYYCVSTIVLANAQGGDDNKLVMIGIGR